MIADGSEIQDRLCDLVQKILGTGAVVPLPFPLERQLSDLGVSSLKMVNLMLAVEIEFDIEIPQHEITPENFHCVASIQTLVGRILNSRSTA